MYIVHHLITLLFMAISLLHIVITLFPFTCLSLAINQPNICIMNIIMIIIIIINTTFFYVNLKSFFHFFYHKIIQIGCRLYQYSIEHFI